MGDAGEGLVDAESRAQERMDELERHRESKRVVATQHPEQMHALESVRLMRAELDRQMQATQHPARKAMLTQAIAELDQRRTELLAPSVAPVATKKKK